MRTVPTCRRLASDQNHEKRPDNKHNDDVDGDHNNHNYDYDRPRGLVSLDTLHGVRLGTVGPRNDDDDN